MKLFTRGNKFEMRGFDLPKETASNRKSRDIHSLLSDFLKPSAFQNTGFFSNIELFLEPLFPSQKHCQFCPQYSQTFHFGFVANKTAPSSQYLRNVSTDPNSARTYANWLRKGEGNYSLKSRQFGESKTECASHNLKKKKRNKISPYCWIRRAERAGNQTLTLSE